jgi:hypothetical protein
MSGGRSRHSYADRLDRTLGAIIAGNLMPELGKDLTRRGEVKPTITEAKRLDEFGRLASRRLETT